ncbi:hypothetical protein [Streptomyces sp. NPDC026673]|uniref:hypothetical protein n=1 Tax=Streptomyces sp. NPDC026673 TaxID=3155724 RepID=UPI0033ED64FB
MINTLCDHLPVPGHWTGSVLFALLAVCAFALAVRDAVHRQWTPAVRDASGALGFACISASNEGYAIAAGGYGAAFFFTISMAASLFIQRANRKKQTAA